jgi:hypothetical protein
MNRPRWLYHGTSEMTARAAVMGGGLRPRGDAGTSNWAHAAESNPALVYLTDTYPAHFAGHATEEGTWAVVEVDAKRLVAANFRPDEDALEQGSRDYPGWEGVPADADTRARTLYFRDNADRLRSHWRESLRLLGTVGYKGIVPPRAIRRIAFFDPLAHPVLAMTFMDATITLTNFSALRLRHRALTRWLFEGVAEERMEQTVADVNAYGDLELLPQLLDTDGVEYWRQLLKDRTGVRVNDNPGYLKGGK